MMYKRKYRLNFPALQKNAKVFQQVKCQVSGTTNKISKSFKDTRGKMPRLKLEHYNVIVLSRLKLDHYSVTVLSRLKLNHYSVVVLSWHKLECYSVTVLPWDKLEQYSVIVLSRLCVWMPRVHKSLMR